MSISNIEKQEDKEMEQEFWKRGAVELRSIANRLLGKGLISLDDYAKVCRVNNLELF